MKRCNAFSTNSSSTEMKFPNGMHNWIRPHFSYRLFADLSFSRSSTERAGGAFQQADSCGSTLT